MEQPKLLERRNDAARMLSISLRTLERLILAKEIKVVRRNRRVLVLRRSLEEFVRKNAQ
jgi:excisionase family DNA binding protein